MVSYFLVKLEYQYIYIFSKLLHRAYLRRTGKTSSSGVLLRMDALYLHMSIPDDEGQAPPPPPPRPRPPLAFTPIPPQSRGKPYLFCVCCIRFLFRLIDVPRFYRTLLRHHHHPAALGCLAKFTSCGTRSTFPQRTSHPWTGSKRRRRRRRLRRQLTRRRRRATTALTGPRVDGDKGTLKGGGQLPRARRTPSLCEIYF